MESTAQILPVVFVFLLLGAVLFIARGGLRKRWPRVGQVQSIEAVERLALTPHHTLHRVRMEGREMLVATHPQGCTLLYERAVHERELHEPAQQRASFG